MTAELAQSVESRPHPEFCGEKWWQDMDVILDEAMKRSMKVWILDDSHFPTGFANGAMEKQPDSMCRQSICCKVMDVTGKEVLKLSEELNSPTPFQPTMIEGFILGEQRKFTDDRLLSVIAKRTEDQRIVNLSSKVDCGTLYWEVPEGEWNLYILHLSRNFGYHRSYINLLNKESCKVLIDAVYEPHFAHYKEHFGKTIAGFFSDEPELGNGHLYAYQDHFGSENDYPWSDELEKALYKCWGDQMGEMLTFLWDTQSDAEKSAKARFVYMDTVTKLVRENFSKQIGTWCEERGVQYIGHLIEDDNHHSRTGSSLGHFFRGLFGQHMAGIDDIGGQVMPQGEDFSYDQGEFAHRNGSFYHYLLGKLGSSAAAIEPHKNGNCMCEIFGNYGWEEGVRLEKYLVDHFMVRGVNCFVPHAFSPKEFPDPDCPPHFYAHGNNPQYRHFGELMRYTNRVCNLIHGGYHSVSAAILYHGESDWMGGSMTSDQIGHVLYDCQLDYDVIPMDVFEEKAVYKTEIRDHMFTVNTQTYPVLIIPGFEYVTEKLTETILEMEKNHIPVIFAGCRPKGICDGDNEFLKLQLQSCGQAASLDEIADMLEIYREVKLKCKNDRVRCLRYVSEDHTVVYLLVNEGTEAYQGNIHFLREKSEKLRTVYEYDAWENKLYELENEAGELSVCIEPLKSKIILFGSWTADPEMVTNRETGIFEETVFSHEWKISICRSIDYPAFEKEKTVALPDAVWTEEPFFSGYVQYKNQFMANEGECYLLEISDAYEGVEVFLNGISQKIQIVPPYRYRLEEGIRTGENDIWIEVASTLGREMSKYPNTFGQMQESEAKSGITGEVHLYQMKTE